MKYCLYCLGHCWHVLTQIFDQLFQTFLFGLWGCDFTVHSWKSAFSVIWKTFHGHTVCIVNNCFIFLINNRTPATCCVFKFGFIAGPLIETNWNAIENKTLTGYVTWFYYSMINRLKDQQMYMKLTHQKQTWIKPVNNHLVGTGCQIQGSRLIKAKSQEVDCSLYV